MSKPRTYDIDRLADAFRALSNPQRLRILLKLATCCGPRARCGADAGGVTRCVGDLGADLGLAPSTVSHHLKELRQAGLMEVERRGQRIECWVSEDTLRLLASFLNRPRETRAPDGERDARAGGANGKRKR
jgi:DNA-binding transcriptional ArsR family regulator